MEKTKKYVSTVVTPQLPELEVALWHSRKRMLSRLGERGMSPELLDGAAAQVTRCGDIYHVLDECGRGVPEHEHLALLAHEAVHVALGHLSDIGETECAEEEFAYAVQAVCSALFEAQIAHWEGKHLGGVRQ